MTNDRPLPRTGEIPVWDLPVRIGHWLLVALFAISWWTAENEYDDIHLWSGYAILAVLLFRLMWGFAGSSTARFGQFVRGPRKLLDYLRRARNWKRAGHTPLGALSVVLLLVLLLLQVALGLIARDPDKTEYGPLAYLVDKETNDLAMQAHEAVFNLLLSFVALHIGAILFYRFVRGKRLVRAMISGRGDYPAGTEPLRPAGGGRLAACLIAAIAVTAWIIAGAPPFRG